MYARAVVQQHRSTPLPLTGFVVSSRCTAPSFTSVVTVEKSGPGGQSTLRHAYLAKIVLGKQC